ncbi:MAG: helix-turn-helix transcriptional regulator [Acidobacteriota bacterium]
MAHLDERTLADRWSMSPRTLQRWRQDNKGPQYLKLGGRVVYRLTDVEAWERAHLQGGSSPDPLSSGGTS